MVSRAERGSGRPSRSRDVLKLRNWTCYSCGLELAGRLRRINGVSDVSLNFFTEQVMIEHEGADMEEVKKEIRSFGMETAGDMK